MISDDSIHFLCNDIMKGLNCKHCLLIDVDCSDHLPIQVSFTTKISKYLMSFVTGIQRHS
jgi:hypothetical protein